MGPKPAKKLTKKQQQELDEKLKEEAKQEKLRELERKRLEEERNMKIKVKNEGIQDEINKAKEEIEFIDKDYRDNIHIVNKRNELMKKFKKAFVNYIDWQYYSKSEEGYIDIRKENQLNGFIHEIKERIDALVYHNFTFKEKNITEEMLVFEYYCKNYLKLKELFYEGIAENNNELLEYSVKYSENLKNLTQKNLDNLTKYFFEDFEKITDMHKNPSKYKLGQQSVEKNNINWNDMCIEWMHPNKKYFLGFFCNVESKQREANITNFRNFPCKIFFLPKQITVNPSVVRIVHHDFDENDILNEYNNFFQYLSINGFFQIDIFHAPYKKMIQGKWEVKEINTEIKKLELNNAKDGGFSIQAKMSLNCQISKNLLINDIKNNTVPLHFGYYSEVQNKWIIESDKNVLIKNEEENINNEIFSYEFSELSSFSFFIDKKYLYPYKSWYLRTIVKQMEVLNFETNKTELKTRYIARLDLESKFEYNFSIKIKFNF